MISELHSNLCCRDDIKEIENYEEAVNDETQTWICHHILGEILSREQLIDHDFYYKVPSCMLKFVTKGEHNRIHFKSKKFTEEHKRRISEANKGNHKTEAHRKKLSKSLSGENHPNYGKHLSEETRRKLSEAAKRRYASKK